MFCSLGFMSRLCFTEAVVSVGASKELVALKVSQTSGQQDRVRENGIYK